MSKCGYYVHVPFCEQHCHYCAFVVAVSPRSTWSPHVDSIVTEIRLANNRLPADTIYLGGGTPSLLTGADIGRLVTALPSGASEISLEANPGTLSPEKLRAYRDAGVNRISLGAQSFDSDDLRKAGRLHKPKDTVDDFSLLRSAGYSNINIDLIAGLPDQSRSAWLKNLEWIGSLAPEHVSIYMLDQEEGSRWGHSPPSDLRDQDYAWFYETAVEELDRLGFRHYEISNWAQPGSECRHNLTYWNGGPYRGFGLGAHSFIDGTRFWNTRRMEDYTAAVQAQRLPIDGQETRTRDIAIEEAFMLGLRQVDGLDLSAVAASHGIQYTVDWFKQVQILCEANLIHHHGNRLKLSPRGWLLANSVIEELLWPHLLSISEATP